MKVDVDPMTGEAVQELVEQVHRTTPADVVERVRTMMAAAVRRLRDAAVELRCGLRSIRRKFLRKSYAHGCNARLTCQPRNLAMN